MRGASAWFAVAMFVPAGVASIACGTSRPTAPVDDEDAGDAAVDVADASTDGGADVDVDPVCPLPGVYGSEECERCLKARCCAVIAACEASSTCQPLNHCVLGCLPDPDAGGCRLGCEGRFPEGRPGMLAIIACGAAEAPQGCRPVCSTTSR